MYTHTHKQTFYQVSKTMAAVMKELEGRSDTMADSIFEVNFFTTDYRDQI